MTFVHGLLCLLITYELFVVWGIELARVRGRK